MVAFQGGKSSKDSSTKRSPARICTSGQLCRNCAGAVVVWCQYWSQRYTGKNIAGKQRQISLSSTFLGSEASELVNIDSKVRDQTEANLRSSNRWSFDEAAVGVRYTSVNNIASLKEHIYTLMKNDSYQRFLRSDFYKEFEQSSSKNKVRRVH